MMQIPDALFMMGDPRSSILVGSVIMSYGSSMLKLLTTREKLPAARPTLIISVFDGLTSRLIRFNSVIHLCTSLRTDRHVIEIPDDQFRLYTTGDLIYCQREQERADRITLLDT